MSSRNVVALALIIAGIACERFAYYGARSFLVHDMMREGGQTMAAYASLSSTMTWTAILTSFVGAGIALAIGPRPTAALGAIIGALGCFVLAAGSYKAGAIVLGAGAGILRPCPLAAAAETLSSEDGDAAPSPRRFAAVAAFALFMYAAINVASMLAPVVSGLFRGADSSGVAYGIDGGVALIGAMCAGAAAFVGLARPNAPITPPPTDVYRTPAFGPTAGVAPPGNALVGIAILGTAYVIYTSGLNLTTPSYKFSFPSWIHSVNPVIVFLCATVLGVVWMHATQQRWSLSPLVFYGAGLAVFGFGLLVLGFAGDSLPGFLLGDVIAAAGESAAGAIGGAYAALSLRGRASAFVVAGWSAFPAIVGMSLGSFHVREGSSTGMQIVFGLMVIAIGGAIAAFARRLHRGFFEPSPNVTGNV